MLDWLEIILRLLAAAAIGAAIGLNRYLHHKATGVRTLSLIACSAAALVMTTFHGDDGVLHYDALSRVIQGILTGLGFIGAGVILRDQSTERVHGLTTAASVWTTAALGALCGVGAWKVVTVLALVVGVVLLGGGPIERLCRSRFGRPGDPHA